MSLFFETLKVQEGCIHNLSYHNRRLNRTIFEVFGNKSHFNLEKYIQCPSNKQLYRCKIIYNTTIQNISLYPYIPKKYHSFKLISCEIDYHHKSMNRTAIDHCFSQKESCDDIIIIQDGLLTDTSIANIALFDGINWYTPQTPLLEGTYRASLLEKNFLKTKKLRKKELQSCVKFAIMNAMVGFYELKNISFI